MSADYDQLLGFVTRMVWRKPELSDREIVEAIRFYPDVKDNRDQWQKRGEEEKDQHLLSKLAEVEAKRKAS